MEKQYSVFFLLFFFSSVLLCSHRILAADYTDFWDYAEVRTGAHLFWWYYTSLVSLVDPSKPWPIVLWLEGGPGDSGVAMGNFLQIGPETLNSGPRPHHLTWLSKADLLFVDSPVGTGFSFVNDPTLLVKTDVEAASDLLLLLERRIQLQNRPLYIVGEGYGGRIAVCLGLKMLHAITNTQSTLQLGGIILGDSWISPEDHIFALGPLLSDLSRIENNGLEKFNSYATAISNQLSIGQYGPAKDTWEHLQKVIGDYSSNVDFNNLRLDKNVPTTTMYDTLNAYSRNYSTKFSNDMSNFMNGETKRKLRIIPPHVSWGSQRHMVFQAMRDDYMKPRNPEVLALLRNGVSVTIYNGQYDLVCSTKGVEQWVENMIGWDGLASFLNKEREPIEMGDATAFVKSYKNLAFYWILDAGHYVPSDQPALLQHIIGMIVKTPAITG